MLILITITRLIAIKIYFLLLTILALYILNERNI